jgi:ribonuclease HI
VVVCRIGTQVRFTVKGSQWELHTLGLRFVRNPSLTAKVHSSEPLPDGPYLAVARRNKEAIAAALDYAQESFEQEPPKYLFEAPRLRVTILSDSQHALEAIRAGNSARTGRALLRRIAESFHALEERGIDVEFRWVPGHAGVCGNTEADRAAREQPPQQPTIFLLTKNAKSENTILRLETQL